MHKIGGAHVQCRNSHYAKFKYQGMKTVGVTYCTNQSVSKHFEGNKSAAGMQPTLPQDIFNAKKIILKLDLFTQNLKKIGKEMPKIESEKPIYNVNHGP